MISVGTPSIAFDARPDALFKMLATPGAGRFVLALPSPLPVYRRLLARPLGRAAVDASPRDLVRATYLGTRRSGLARTVSSYLREQFRGQRAQPPRYVLRDSELARIQRPVLVVWGNRDTRYQPIAEAPQDRADTGRRVRARHRRARALARGPRRLREAHREIPGRRFGAHAS